MVKCDGDFDRSVRDHRGESDDVSLDTAFELLADRRRRLCLHLLSATEDDVVTVDDVVEYVHRHDPDVRERERLALECHHTVFPRLEAAGTIEYDPLSETIRYYPNEVIERFLEQTMDTEFDGFEGE